MTSFVNAGGFLALLFSQTNAILKADSCRTPKTLQSVGLVEHLLSSPIENKKITANIFDQEFPKKKKQSRLSREKAPYSRYLF